MKNNQTKIKCIVFDMDGVLIDAKEWHFFSLNNALNLFGEEINRDEHNLKFDGLSTKKKLNMLSDESRIPLALHSTINMIKQNFTINHIFQDCNPIFQHEYALSKLKNEGYKLALASNSIRATVELMMERANLSKYFDLILSNNDVTNPKPNPEIYTLTMKKLNVHPIECLILEDNDYGIAAARASGAHCMIINSVKDVSYENIKNKIETL